MHRDGPRRDYTPHSTDDEETSNDGEEGVATLLSHSEVLKHMHDHMHEEPETNAAHCHNLGRAAETSGARLAIVNEFRLAESHSQERLPRGLPMVDLHLARTASDSASIDEPVTNQSTEPLLHFQNAWRNSSTYEYSMANKMASSETNPVLACLLDIVSGTRMGCERRTHSENPAETEHHRQRCSHRNAQTLQNTMVGVKVEVVVPVETLGNRFGTRSPQNTWKSKNDTTRRRENIDDGTGSAGASIRPQYF